jgi:hypothetical protein
MSTWLVVSINNEASRLKWSTCQRSHSYWIPDVPVQLNKMQYPQKYTGTVCINATRQLAEPHFLT